MTKSEIRDIVITGSYLINNGMKEPANGWEDYANKLEDMLVKNNGVLRIVSNNEALASNEGVAVCYHPNAYEIEGGWKYCPDCGVKYIVVANYC